MANTLAPIGFKFARLLNAASPNYATLEVQLAYNQSSKIAHCDPVYLGTDGFLHLYVKGGTTIMGIFRGCKYLDPSQGRDNWFASWQAPTLPSTTTVTAWVDADPQAIFQVQASGGPVVQANIGQNLDILTGTSGAPGINGQSTCAVDATTIADTATLPFRITGIVQAPAINYLYNGAVANNWVEVMLNTSNFTTRTGQA